MDYYYIRLFFFTVFTIISAHDSLAQCVKTTPCSCIREDGTGYDLTSLINQKFLIDVKNNIKFQPCKNVDLTFDESKSNESECNSASICMLDSKNQSISLGKSEDTVWNLPLGFNNDPYLMIHHVTPKKITYESKIILACCHLCDTPILNVNVSSETKYNFILTWKHSCLATLVNKGLSVGSLLVILLIVFSAVYFIGGAVALKVFRGAVGLELIPNYDFWADLPGLVRDGVAFTFSGCTVVSYDRI